MAASSKTFGSVFGWQTLQAAWRRRSRRAGIKPSRLFILPAAAFVLVLFVLPNLLNFFYAFTDWTTYRSSVKFVGIQNFRDLAQDGTIWDTLRTTLLFAIFVTAVVNLGSITLALLLERSTHVNRILRSIFFVPVLISSLAVGYILKGIFASNGVLNNGLSTIGSFVGTRPIQIQWLGSVRFTLFILGLVWAWKWGGIYMLIYLSLIHI